ncbi:unnamed protein product [Adineta steineri]|nr:unnamed protein product [Adineta steineri]CAF3817572.1 unnamed protein product [Adineta steineri]
MRQLSPEIPSPVKPAEPKIVDDDIGNKIPDDDIENQIPDDKIEIKHDIPVTDSNETKIDLINPMAILFANGQPLLTNFEEKYLIDLILKTTNKDIETILQEKIPSILQMNYGSQSTLFQLNIQWIFDFLLKHFQTLIEHIHSRELFEKILNKNIDKNNSTIVFKHWQLQTLVNEHLKTKQQSSMNSQKRRMTVRHINFN